MRFSVLIAALCAPSALSFPWLAPEGLDALLNHPEARAEIDRRLKEHQVSQEEKSHEPRQLKTGVVGGVVSLLGGTVEAVVDNVLGLIPTNKAVKGLQKFPEASHPFKAPGKTDQRGPCPGLNTLANHGYIPRNGIATIGQIQAGTAKLFNMGADLSALLAVGGAVDGGDILSQKMSIGGPDNRVGLLNGALNKIFGKPSGIAGHGKFNEGDASATREDFYLNGDNISFKSELFKQMHQQALAKGDGTYNVDAIKEHFKNRYRDSKAANKQFYFNVPSAAVVMGAYYFIPGFFSNGTIGAGGIANEASITSFYGAKPKRKNAWKDKDLEYTHVPERIPEQGWYRRATPMTIPEAVGGILDVYLYAQPALGGSGADGSWVVGPLDLPKDPQGLSCFLYNAIFANFPSELFNSVRLLQSILNGISSALVPGYKALGCKVDFPDAKGSSASKKFAEYEKKYVGPAKTKAMSSLLKFQLFDTFTIRQIWIPSIHRSNLIPVEHQFQHPALIFKSKRAKAERDVGPVSTLHVIDVECNGAKPSCPACIRAKTECVYRQYRSSLRPEEEQILERLKDSEQHRQAQSDFINLLLSLPIDQATDMLQRFRDNPESLTVLLSIQSSSSTNFTFQPSNLRSARAIAPPTGSATEFELNAQFSMAYPRIPPVDLQSLRTLLRQHGDSQMKPRGTDITLDLPSGPQNQGETQGLMLASPGEYCDSRLEKLQINYWTKVPVSNELAAELISFYITNDHKILGFFDVDLFLDDLVQCHQRFCSPFLAEEQGYSAIDPGTNDIRNAAIQEAEMLWQGERSDPSFISLAAMGVFSAACILEGKDAIGQECTQSLRYEAERLGLCGSQFDGLLTQNTLNPNTPEWVRTTSQIAWGVYNWLTIHVLYYHHKHIRFPPALPIPGGRGMDERFDAGSKFLGKMFPNTCRLWVLAQEVLGVYSFAKSPISERVPLAFAEGKYQKLLVWAGTLDSHMKRVDGCPPEVMVFHILFHVVTTMIFRPFIAMPRSTRLMSLTSSDSHPKAVYAASVNQLKDLVFSFCAKYPQAAFTTFFNTGLFTLSLALLEDLQDQLWRYYFYLCVRCWQDLYFCYPVFRDIAKAFLSVAMQKDAIAAREAQNLLQGIDQAGEHHTTAEEAFTSFIFDPVSDRVAEAQVHAMADKFEEMVVFDELIDKNTTS
ncbi:Aromatic peroxygenase [Fusarium denticulatum]|uniref:Aromatic peroxygenase n=1 Tax=Fusarium denticulatum TaxID=48507 RepID=A0A8H6CW77_9HYPO|nr:Aromatic peroxygenase [Fusarium denticulatum]